MSNNIAIYILGVCAPIVLKQSIQALRAMHKPVTAKGKELSGELFGRGEVVGGSEWTI
ncbi:hypothetical protein [Weissella kandleri]|uniref:hypothetical protein n=1 Tax=Weissella kandleri TaxID=1616 RepID=UPI000A50E5D2|nr:hypothetical protein [Weissella kandleri]